MKVKNLKGSVNKAFDHSAIPIPNVLLQRSTNVGPNTVILYEPFGTANQRQILQSLLHLYNQRLQNYSQIRKMSR